MKAQFNARLLYTVSLFAMAMLSACSAGGEKPAAAARQPVIAYLATRDGMITIYSSGQGPRFAIAGTSHDRPGTALSLEELEAQYPSVHLMYKSSIAGEGPVLDASL